jgi:exosortase
MTRADRAPRRTAVERAGRWIVPLLLAAVYASTFRWMMRVWWWDAYAAHGVFVPFFSAHFLWVDRAGLRASAEGGDRRGWVLVGLGLAMLAGGWWQTSLLLQGLSSVVTVAGLVVAIFGPRCLRRGLFAIAFLVFMVPLPRWIVAAVTAELQLFAAIFAGAALSLLDVPFYRHGVMIELPALSIEVAEICNGLRFLTALVVLTVALAQMSQRTTRRKVVLALSAIPIAIAANAVRVAAVVMAAHYIGPEAASGVVHNTIGKVVWGLTLVPLAVVGVLLRRGGMPHPARRLA